MPVNFVLNEFNCDIQLDISATVFKYDSLPALEVDATAIYYVDLSDMCQTFLYQTDANDVVDSDITDLKYMIDASYWVNMNPANAQMGHQYSQNPINTYDAQGNKYQPNAMFICHDFVRYLALKLFNSPYGVDLFDNKQDLIRHIRFVCGDSAPGCAWYDLTHKLINIGRNGNSDLLEGVSGNKYLTNAVDDDANICRRIIQTLLTTDPERFSIIEDTTNFQIMPFREYDSINFKLILHPNDYQNELTGVNVIPSRSYGIKFILVKNPQNVEVNPAEL